MFSFLEENSMVTSLASGENFVPLVIKLSVVNNTLLQRA